MRWVGIALWGTALAVASCAGGVMGLRSAATIVVYLTLGLGFPLTYVASVALWLACLGPVVLLLPPSDAGPGRLAVSAVGLAASVALFAATVWGPAAWDRSRAEREWAAFAPDDREPAGPWTGRSLELDWSGEPPAADVARAALERGIAWVALIDRSDRRSPGRAVRTILTPEGWIADDGRPAALTVRVEEERSWEGLTTQRRKIRAFTADGEAVLVRSEVTQRLAIVPGLLGPRWRGLDSQGIEWARTEHRRGDADLARALADLGLPPGGEAAPARSPFEDALALLDLDSAELFTPTQCEVLSRWLVRPGPWTDDEVRAVGRMVGDPRTVCSGGGLQPLLRREPAVLAACLDPLLTVTEASDRIQRGAAVESWEMAWSADPALLEPHRDRILALLSSHPQHRARVLPVVGRLGVDPTPHVTPWLDPKGPGTRAVLLAACRSDGRFRDEWVALLDDLLQRVNPRSDRSVATDVAAVLLWFGEDARVEARMSRDDWPDGAARYARLLERRTRDGGRCPI